MAVCKINIDSDLRVAFTAAIRKHFVENPSHFDPRQYLGDARTMMKEMVKHKITDVFGQRKQGVKPLPLSHKNKKRSERDAFFVLTKCTAAAQKRDAPQCVPLF